MMLVMGIVHFITSVVLRTLARTVMGTLIDWSLRKDPQIDSREV